MAISQSRFEEQILALLGSLQGLARRLTGNEADAEDLVAETIARAWRARDDLLEEGAFRGWIFRILNNTFISEKRRPGGRHEVQVRTFDSDADDAETARFSIFEQTHQPFLLWFASPEQSFLDRVLREELERALDGLPEHYRIVVVLSDLEEFTYAEISETLGIPVGTVRSRLARARSALQKTLWRSAQEYGLAGTHAARDPTTEKT